MPPLHLLWWLMTQEEISYEVTPFSDFHLVSLVLLFGQNKPNVSPPPISPQVTSDSYICSLEDWEGKPEAYLRKPLCLWQEVWGGKDEKKINPRKARMTLKTGSALSNSYMTATQKKVWSLCLPFRQLTWQTALVPSWLNCAYHWGSLWWLICFDPSDAGEKGHAFFWWVPSSWSPSPACRWLLWQFSYP